MLRKNVFADAPANIIETKGIPQYTLTLNALELLVILKEVSNGGQWVTGFIKK